jgi:hypothetical protein
MEQLQVSRISVISLFRPLTLGWATIITPLGLIAAVLAAVGLRVVEFNGQIVTGLSGFATGLAMAIILPPFFAAAIVVILAPGLWLYSKLLGSFKVGFIPPRSAGEHAK